jgi:hypothetical protein
MPPNYSSCAWMENSDSELIRHIAKDRFGPTAASQHCTTWAAGIGQKQPVDNTDYES